MLHRDEFEFILLPWEHPGAHFDARPDAVTCIEFAGAPRAVLLKSHAERLFFRFADWPTDTQRTAVFAVTEPFKYSSEEAETFFHEAIAKKRIARYVTAEFSFGNQELTTLLWLVNENGSQQSGWVREWCGGEWIAWEGKVPSHARASIWDDDWFRYLPKGLYGSIGQTLAQRSFSPEERQNIPANWVRGSAEELSRVLRAIFVAFPLWGQEINDHLNGLEGYVPSGGRRVMFWAWNASSSAIELPSTLWLYDAVHNTYRCELIRRLGPQWATLVADNCYCVGLTWHSKGAGDTERRENWRCETPTFDLDVSLPFSYPHSHHERLEARLFLRDWLRGKVPAEEIEQWLGASS